MKQGNAGSSTMLSKTLRATLAAIALAAAIQQPGPAPKDPPRAGPEQGVPGPNAALDAPRGARSTFAPLLREPEAINQEIWPTAPGPGRRSEGPGGTPAP